MGFSINYSQHIEVLIMKKIKKVLLILISATLCLTMYGCYDYSDFKELYLKDIGTIMIPQQWESDEYNGLLYFYDSQATGSERKITMFESKSDWQPGIDNGTERPGEIEDNIISDSFQTISDISNAVDSNSATYGENKVKIDGERQSMRYIELYDPRMTARTAPVLLYFTDEVSDETYQEIINSFISGVDE